MTPLSWNVFAFALATVYILLFSWVMPFTPLIQTWSPFEKPWPLDVMVTGFALVAPVIDFCAPTCQLAAVMGRPPMIGPRASSAYVPTLTATEYGTIATFE